MMSRGSSVGVVLEKVQNRVAQDFDLPAAAVAGVHANAFVARVEQRALGVGTTRSPRYPVGTHVVLDPS